SDGRCLRRAVENACGLNGRGACVNHLGRGAEIISESFIEYFPRLLHSECRHVDRGLALGVSAALGEEAECQVGDSGIIVNAVCWIETGGVKVFRYAILDWVSHITNGIPRNVWRHCSFC